MTGARQQGASALVQVFVELELHTWVSSGVTVQAGSWKGADIGGALPRRRYVFAGRARVSSFPSAQYGKGYKELATLILALGQAKLHALDTLRA